MKGSFVMFVVALVLLAPAAATPVFADSSTATYTVSLQYLNLQVMYPQQAMPGDAVTVHVKGAAKSAFTLSSLSAQVFYSDGLSLQQLVNATLVSNMYLASGGTVSRDLSLTIPTNAPRTSLTAVFTESAKIANYNYYGYYDYYYPYIYTNAGYPYYYYYYPVYYSAPTYATVTDSAVAPLTYVKAQTPEYLALWSQYQASQQQLNQTRAQNQQIQQKVSARDDQISSLNQQLGAAQASNQTMTTAAAGLGALALIFLVSTAYLAGSRRQQPQPAQAQSPPQPQAST